MLSEPAWRALLKALPAFSSLFCPFTDAGEEVGDAGTEDSAQQLRLGMLALQLFR